MCTSLQWYDLPELDGICCSLKWPDFSRKFINMSSVITELEPIWKTQVDFDQPDLVRAVQKQVPRATESQVRKVLSAFSPPDVDVAVTALINFLNLPPKDGSAVSLPPDP